MICDYCEIECGDPWSHFDDCEFYLHWAFDLEVEE